LSARHNFQPAGGGARQASRRDAQTWLENSPSPGAQSYEPLHPFLYSLDVFLPFVDLHQERYWWTTCGFREQLRFSASPFGGAAH